MALKSHTLMVSMATLLCLCRIAMADCVIQIVNQTAQPISLVSLGIAGPDETHFRAIFVGEISANTSSPWIQLGDEAPHRIGGCAFLQNGRKKVVVPHPTASRNRIADLWIPATLKKGAYLIQVTDSHLEIEASRVVPLEMALTSHAIWDVCLTDLLPAEPALQAAPGSNILMQNLAAHYQAPSIPETLSGNPRAAKAYHAGFRHGWFSVLISRDAEASKEWFSPERMEGVTSFALGDNKDLLKLSKSTFEGFQKGRSMGLAARLPLQ